MALHPRTAKINMQYDVTTPTEYINNLSKDWRFDKVEELRTIILSKAPGLIEEINYKMLSYGDTNGIVFHLNAQKNYISLYVGNTKKIDPDGMLLRGLDIGKGCIRFKKAVDVSSTDIEKFIEKTMRLWEQGADIGCN